MTAAFQVETPSLPAALAPMMTERRWLVWRWEPSPTTGKPTKVPYRADAPDRKAASDNPATWGSFASASRSAAEGKADGIGYALMGSEIAAFDLDDCRDPATGRIDRWALDLIERACSYVEVTVSGSGLRILGRAAGDHVHRAHAVPNSNGARLETYRQAKRYIVVTGNVIEEASAELADLDILIDETIADLDAAAKAKKDRQRAERNRQREVECQRSRRSDDWYEPQAGNLHPQLERIIRYGAPIGERSDEFHHVVGWLKGDGYSPSQIESLLSAYPEGIAEKFSGRLRQEIDRCYDKTDGPRERAHSGERQRVARQAEPPQPIELHWHGEADPNADRAWLIRHLVFETGKGLVAGQWGAGKTFGVLDMSGSVMTGEPFAGRKVMRTGGVLFIAPEGAFEIPVRLRGVVEGKLRGAAMARAATGGPPINPDNLPFVWIEECPPLTKAGSLDRLIATAKAAAAEMDRRFGVPIVLVVIDTVAAGAGFEDENSASETQKVMDAMGTLSRETGAFVLGVDHFGKVSETGTRGSSAKEAAAMWCSRCWRPAARPARSATPGWRCARSAAPGAAMRSRTTWKSSPSASTRTTNR